jgi:hypothetical protein
MDATLNPQPEQQQPQLPMDAQSEKSDLMQFFEMQIKDSYWAYRDLLKALLEKD